MQVKELKRYYLVEYVNTREKIVDTKEETQVILEIINKFNKSKKNNYLYGNVTITKEDDGYHVNSHLYHKLTDRSTITDLDNLTSEFNEKELINKFKNITKTKKEYIPDINIAYFDAQDKKDLKENKLYYYNRIKYIPVLYKDDLCYLDGEFVEKCLQFHTNNYDYSFFQALANEFCSYRVVGEQISEIYSTVNNVKDKHYDKQLLFRSAYNLYKGFIYERDKNGKYKRDENGEYIISRRRQRDFGLFIKNYKMRNEKRISPLKYNKGLSEEGKKSLYNLRDEMKNISTDEKTLKRKI